MLQFKNYNIIFILFVKFILTFKLTNILVISVFFIFLSFYCSLHLKTIIIVQTLNIIAVILLNSLPSYTNYWYNKYV